MATEELKPPVSLFNRGNGSFVPSIYLTYRDDGTTTTLAIQLKYLTKIIADVHCAA